MARPQDLARAAAYLSAQEYVRSPLMDPSESIFTTRARDLETLRRHAREAAHGTGPLTPVMAYRTALDEYRSLLHLAEHWRERDTAARMIERIDRADDRETLTRILDEQETAIDTMHRSVIE